MNNLRNIKNVYFLGIGGIGMSALARYFKFTGRNVAGYDRTPTHAYDTLLQEGFDVHFEDDIRKIPKAGTRRNTGRFYSGTARRPHRTSGFAKNLLACETGKSPRDDLQ